MSRERRSRLGATNTETAGTAKAPTSVVVTSVPEQGRGRVSVTPDPWWLDGALRALRVLAESGRPFTVDELRREPFALPDPHHSGAWGGLVQSATRQGWLQRVGYVTSPAGSRNGGVVSLWRGTQRVRGER